MKRAKGERAQHLSRFAYRARRITFTFINARRCINTKRATYRTGELFYKHLRHPLPAITCTATFTVLNLELPRGKALSHVPVETIFIPRLNYPTRLPMNETLRLIGQLPIEEFAFFKMGSSLSNSLFSVLLSFEFRNVDSR